MERKLLYINKKAGEQDKLSKVRACAILNKIRLIAPDESELKELPEDAELMKLIGFGKDVGGFLTELRKIGIRVDYKCIETESNKDWPLLKLYEELKSEHEEMHRINGGE